MEAVIAHLRGLSSAYASHPRTAAVAALILLVQLSFFLVARRQLASYVKGNEGDSVKNTAGVRAAGLVLYVQEIAFILLMVVILPGLLVSVSGGVGAGIIFVQEVMFLFALVALVGTSQHYRDHLAALVKLIHAGGSQTRSESPQINRLLAEYDRLRDLGVERPDVENLVSEYVGNDSRLKLDDWDEDGTARSAGPRLRRSLLDMSWAPAFVRFVMTTMVGIGLLGTFVGFTFTLSDLSGSLESLRVEILGEPGSDSPGGVGGAESGQRPAGISGTDERQTIVEQLVDQIRTPLGGMYTAFATSVVGLFLSIMLTLVKELWCNYPLERRRLVQQLRAFLDGEYARRRYAVGEEKPSTLVLELRNLTANLVEAMRYGLDSGFGKVTQELFHTNAAMGNMLAEISRLLGSFNKASEGMLLSSQALEEYGKTNEQILTRMEAVVAGTHQDTLRLASALQELAAPLGRFSALVQESVATLHNYERTIEGFGQEILGVTTAALADMRRMIQMVMDLQTEVGAAVARLPGDMAAAAANQLMSGLDHPIADLSGSVETMKTNVESMLSMVAHYDKALASIWSQYESLGRVVADEFARTIKLQEQAIARLEDVTCDLGVQVSQLTSSYRAAMTASNRLISELDRVFALDALAGSDANQGNNGGWETAATGHKENQLGGRAGRKA